MRFHLLFAALYGMIDLPSLIYMFIARKYCLKTLDIVPPDSAYRIETFRVWSDANMPFHILLFAVRRAIVCVVWVKCDRVCGDKCTSQWHSISLEASALCLCLRKTSRNIPRIWKLRAARWTCVIHVCKYRCLVYINIEAKIYLYLIVPTFYVWFMLALK